MIENFNYFTLEVLQELFEKCNVTFEINDGRIVNIGYMFG